jgi:hypothetical protein
MAMVDPSGFFKVSSPLTILGQPGDKIYRDTDDIGAITSWDMPGNPQREIDDVVMTDGKALNVPTAIIARAQLTCLVQQTPLIFLSPHDTRSW